MPLRIKDEAKPAKTRISPALCVGVCRYLLIGVASSGWSGAMSL